MRASSICIYGLCGLLLVACSAGGASSVQRGLTQSSPPEKAQLVDNPLKVVPTSGCAELDFYWQDGDALVVNCDGDTKAFLPPFDAVASVQVEPKPVVESVKPANESYSIEVDEHTVAICGEGRLSLNQTNTQSKATLGRVPYCGPMAVRPNRELWLWPQGIKDPSWGTWDIGPFMRWDLKTHRLLPTPNDGRSVEPFVLYFPRIESFWVNEDRVVRNLGNRVVATDFHGSEPKEGWSFSGADSDQRSLMSKTRNWIATTCARSSVCVLNTATGENHQVAHPAFTYLPRTVSLVRSSSGRVMASRTVDEHLRLFDLQTGTLDTIIGSRVFGQYSSSAHMVNTHDMRLGWKLRDDRPLRLRDDGASATLTARNEAWVLSFETHTWATTKSKLSLPGPDGFVVRAGRLERQTNSGVQQIPAAADVDGFIVSEDGSRVVVQSVQSSSSLVELWTAAPPFKRLQGPLDLKGVLSGVSRDGSVFWSDKFLFRSGHAELTSIEFLRGSELYVARDDSVWVKLRSPFLNPGGEQVSSPVDVYRFLADGSLMKDVSAPDPFSPERMARAELGRWAEGTAVESTDSRFLFTWAPKWFAQVLPNGTIEIGAAPGKPAMISLRTVDHRDAGYVFTPDGRYDLLGREAEQAARFLVCTDHGERVAFEQCKSRREPGLLAHVIAQLEQAAN